MLTIDHVSRSFGSTRVLNDVSMSLLQGQVTCIVGPSGCGKSTLLRLVAGLDRPDAGEIRIGGDLVSSAGWSLPAHRRKLNMVFQDYALWPHMRVSHIVGYGLAHLSRAERNERVVRHLSLLRIDALADRLPSQLSGGQQQRVAIARALATDPRILLLDEPLSNLDVQLRMEMRLEFADLFARLGKTVLYVTHDPLEACTFADRLVVMRSGEIEEEGTPESLFSKPRSAWVATLAGYDIRLKATGLGRSEDGCRGEVGGQTIMLAAADTGPSRIGEPGEALTVMLHPSAIRLPPDERPGDNRLSGRVVACLYEGRQWRVSLHLGDVDISILVQQRCAIGDVLTICFDPADGAAFPAA